MNTTVNTLNHIVRHRRSIKPERYTGVAVADEIVHEMLENARWAPTHALTEPWRFFVFTGDGLQKFAHFQSELYKTITAPDQFNENKYNGLRNTPLKASHIILIGMSRQETQKIPVMEEIAAVSCAVQNMMLTATAHGIGSYWSTSGVVFKPEMKTFLGLGENDQCLGMLYIGNYNGEVIDSTRKPISDKSEWITSN